MSAATALIAPIMVTEMMRRAGVGIGGAPIDIHEYVRAFLDGRTTA
jgi:hypothetical protein